MRNSGITDTRRRLIDLLRTRGEQTVEELARGLHLTRSSVRSHLAFLQADAYVVRRGVRAGKRRPSVVYGLTPAADALFPTAYGEFVATLMEEIKSGKPRNLDTLLRKVGDRWIARDLPLLDGTSGFERMKKVKDILATRGFMPDLERSRSHYTIREYNCPLLPMVAPHVEVCDMVHRWLTALVGAPVQRAQCMREGAAHSAYIIPTAGPAVETRRR